MKWSHSPRSGPALRALSVASILTAVAVATAGCSPDPQPTTSPEGGGVPFGAPIGEWHAAFAEIEPILLRTQAFGPEGSLTTAPYEAYAEALHEWSDGKVTLEIAWSGSLVPAATEWAAALADGRLDLGSLVPSYTPEVLPMLNSLAEATILDPTSPTSSLITASWQAEVVLNEEAYLDELEEAGLFPILPITAELSATDIFCTEPKEGADELDGTQIAVSGTGPIAVIEALGMVPVAISYDERYEALQRNLVSCILIGPNAIGAQGLGPLIPYVLADSRVSFPFPAHGLYIGLDRWNELPLVIRQLLVDRADAYLAGAVRAQYEKFHEVFAAVEEFVPYDEESVAAIERAKHALLEGVADQGSDVAVFEERSAEWTWIINEELGLGSDLLFGEYVAEREFRSLDVDAWVARYYEDVILPHRPS